MRDSRMRSAAKSFAWRTTGIVLLGILGYIATGSVEEASAITFTFHAIRLFMYYVHERVWERIGWGRSSPSSPLLLYALLAALALCFIVLGVLAWM